MQPTIIFTGGGTAGHVIPNLVLIEALRNAYTICYLGCKSSVEEQLVAAQQIQFHAIRSGKLRRYASWKNLKDPFNILFGIWQAYKIIKKQKPQIVFSKGGFVAFPVVVGAWLNRIPVVAHESDMTPGLANRLSLPFINKICLTFSPTVQHFRPNKITVTGTPIRDSLFLGSKARAFQRCNFSLDNAKQCLLVIGGSQGAGAINQCIRDSLAVLTKGFNIIHLCGKNKVDPALDCYPSYYQCEYANEELADFFAAADLVVSRSGSNTLCEILALAKPHVLIPLPAATSRGDQIENAQYFKNQGISVVLQQENLTQENLVASLDEASRHAEASVAKMRALNLKSARENIIKILMEILHAKSTATM